jgi:hypothetical protein
MVTEVTKGDNIDFRSRIEEPVINWKIRATIWDEDDNVIRKATANSGGTDDQIQVTDLSNGEFVVHILKGETAGFLDVAQIEIQVEPPTGEVYTLLKDTIVLTPRKIDWVAP